MYLSNAIRRTTIVVVALSAAGCAGSDDFDVPSEESVSSTKQEIVNLWTRWISEETPGVTTCGSDANVGALAAACSHSYCRYMRLFCGTLPAGFRTTDTANLWTQPVSEETGELGAYCGSGRVIDGMVATGLNSDNVSVHCRSTTWPSQGVNCKWTPWFSEEIGQQGFVGPGLQQAVAVGVACRGSYCDDMRYYVCEPKCTSDASCNGGYCVSGVCRIG